jgi:peptidyl-prolyl cis-trans isomerase C
MPQQMIFPAVVDQIVNGKLVAQAGYAAKLEDDKDVKDRVKRAEERAVQEVYLARNVESRITPEALQERYKKYLADNPPQEEVKASHILVASEAEAKDIIKQLKGGADFAKLAKEKSTDKAAAAQGGDLGYFTRDQMVEPFAKAAFEAKPGTLLDQPVQTQFGWHVIKVEDRRKAPPPTFEEVQDELRTQLSESLIGKVVDDLRNKAKIEKFAADGSPLPAESGTALKPAQ